MTEPIRLGRHADVIAAAQDPRTFSSRTSAHLHVPNGMDGDEHRAYRELVDRQLTPRIVAGLQLSFDAIAREVVQDLPRGIPVEAVGDVGEVFAVRAQCDWLGWPAELETELREWMASNYAAARGHDAVRGAEVAAAFDALVGRQVSAHRAARARGEERGEERVAARGEERHPDATDRLLDERIGDRPLTEEELVSILRNWTAGDLGSLARSVGVIVERLASHPRWQERMRTLASGIRSQATGQADDRSAAELDAILAECLRMDDPFVANRRITTCPVTTPSGVPIPAGASVLLDWVAANRDPDVFDDRFDPQAHGAQNVVFGAGPHICPGRDLSFAELRAIIVALLDGTKTIEPAGRPIRHDPPIGGWARMPILLR